MARATPQLSGLSARMLKTQSERCSGSAAKASPHTFTTTSTTTAHDFFLRCVRSEKEHVGGIPGEIVRTQPRAALLLDCGRRVLRE